MIGWIKVYRKVWENPRSKDPEWISVWVYLLTHAVFEEKKITWKGEPKILKPGQLLTGRKRIAANTGISESKVQRVLNWLKNAQQIEQQVSNVSSLITILNWPRYQGTEQPNNQPPNSHRTTGEQPPNTNKEIQEVLRTEERKEEGDSAPAREEFLISNLYEKILAKLESCFTNDSQIELLKGQTSFKGDVREEIKNFAAHYSAHKEELAHREPETILNWFRNWLVKDGRFAQRTTKPIQSAEPQKDVYRRAYRRPDEEPELSDEEKQERKRRADEAIQKLKESLSIKGYSGVNRTQSLRDRLGTKQFEPQNIESCQDETSKQETKE